MLLKKITLNNIRSYEQVDIEFPSGSILLSGDIGSGKTSVLLGVEFALFGLQPGQRGSSLLKNGKKDGGVTMEFEVEGKDIIIERTLKRAKTISQDYCAITIDGEKKEISVTELKNLVLELLNYPSEFSKKQNLLYKFTVYTPQEEMKQIILQDPVTRINTLRHIFGIDKYKRILENIATITSKLREEQRRKEGMIEGLEQDKFNLIEKENELETKQYNLASVEKELFLKTEQRKKVQEEKEEIKEKIEEKKKFDSEIEKTNIMLTNKKEAISDNNQLIEQIKKQIQELKELRFDEKLITQTEQEITKSKSQKEKLNEENLEIISQITSINLKNQENENIKQKIVHIEVCPTCLQDVNPSYKMNVINKLDSNTSENQKKIEILEKQKQEISEKTKEIDSEISENEAKLSDFKILEIKLQGIEEKEKRIEDIEKSNTLLEKDIGLLNEHAENLKKSIFDLRKFDNLFEEKQKELEQAQKEEKMTEIKIAELKKEIEVFSRHIDELREKILKAEEIKKQLDYIASLENWLSKNFTSLISFIEKNVMIKLKKDFSELFNEWFCMLVSDSFEVSLDDNFTPIIEQQDYEIDYQYLSGGERTAVALAYRLALNQVINSFLSKINTKDLVILDEPTDGFSEQQLDKMRDVLEQLNVAQLILVSHEQKIESFVENVIKFRKENGISGIEV